MEIDFVASKQRELLRAQIGYVFEKDIFELLNRAELLLEENFSLGKKLLRQADGLYHWQGDDFDIKCRIGYVSFLYDERGLLPEKKDD